MIRKIVLLLSTILISSCASSGDILWPKPASFTFTPDGETVTVNPCSINFVVESPSKYFVQQIIMHY